MNGSPHFSGTMTYADGRIYQGEFWQGERHGQGELLKNQTSFEGWFIHGNFAGTLEVVTYRDRTINGHDVWLARRNNEGYLEGTKKLAEPSKKHRLLRSIQLATELNEREKLERQQGLVQASHAWKRGSSITTSMKSAEGKRRQRANKNISQAKL